MTSKETPSQTIGPLYETYGALLYRTAYALTLSRQDAEDVVQDTFLKVLRNPPVFRETDHARAWLIRVTVNGAKDLLRRRKIRRSLNLEEIADQPLREVHSPLLEEVFALPPDQRMPLLLHYMEDFTVREVAAMLKLSESAVKMRLLRGRQALKHELERSEDHV